MDIRDYFVPDPGFYGALYNYFYTTDRYNDQNGNQVSSTTLPDGSGSPVSVNLDMYVLAPAFIWVSPWKVLGAKYGAYIAPTFANSSLNAVASTVRGRGGTGVRSDLRPGRHVCATAVAGLVTPALGFLSRLRLLRPGRQIQHRNACSPPPAPSTCRRRTTSGWASGRSSFRARRPGIPGPTGPPPSPLALTYEYNSQQEGTGITYGQNLWLNWGISQYLPLTKDHKLLLEVGPAGYYEWQVSSDTGGTSNPRFAHLG